MTVLDLALLVFILYVAVNIRHRLSMGLALGQLAGMIYLDFFMRGSHQPPHSLRIRWPSSWCS